MKSYFLIILFFLIVSCNDKKSIDKIKFCGQSLSINETSIICVNKKNLDLKRLSKFKNIVSLDLTGSIIKKFIPLKNLKSLKCLSLNETNFSDTDILRSLNNLEILRLNSTNIKSLEYIKDLKHLKYISLIKNKVKLQPLDYLLRKGDFYLEIDDSNIDYNFLNKYFKKNIYKNTNFIIYRPKNNNKTIVTNSTFKKGYVIQNNTYIKKGKIFSECQDLLISENNIDSKNIYLYYFDENKKYLKLKNITSLLTFNNLEVLKIYIVDETYINIISKLNKLKKLYLILGEKVKKIPRLPLSLDELYIYANSVNNFNSIKKSKLKYVEFIVKDFKNHKYFSFKNKNPLIDIKISDFYLNSNNIFIDDLGLELQYIQSNELKKIKLPDIKNYIYSYITYNFQLMLKSFIKNNELDEIILTNNKDFISHILKHYDFNLNELNESQKTILDEVSGEVDKEIISLLKIHGAKRSCEILKTKCEPLNPEIEKILKNDKK